MIEILILILKWFPLRYILIFLIVIALSRKHHMRKLTRIVITTNKSIFFCVTNNKSMSTLSPSQAFIGWTKALPGQFICLKMPLKFRKIRFSLYFRTFNLSSNATSILYMGYLHCEYTAKTLLWHWGVNILYYLCY